MSFLAVFTPVLAMGAGQGTNPRTEEKLALNSPMENALPEQSPPAPIVEESFPASPATAAPAKSPIPATSGTNAPEIVGPQLITETTLTQGDLWQRIRNGFAMQDIDSKLVTRHERWYAGHPDYVARMTERSRLYLYFIVSEVEKRGMPTEIALLPMIESGFNPEALSVSRASGIWQFIPSTGKKYGMSQNWWYDGRRDIISATSGALDYLQALHEQFGDWSLALAAYNCGEGAVQRAQERNRKNHKPTDYLHLKLPRETLNYVPKLLAVKHIISDPGSFNLALQPVPNRAYFTAIPTDHHMDVKVAAELAGMSMEEFTALNPAHDRPVILQDSSDVLLLPVDKVETFHKNLESYGKPLVTWQPYQSKKGERLDSIASRFGLSLSKLKSTNGFPPQATLAKGQTLLVPANGEESSGDFEAFNTNLPPSFDYSHTTIHVVRRGETLGGIARRYHVSVASLKANNHNSIRIHLGQHLVVTGGHESSARRVRIAKVSKHRSRHAARSTNIKIASSR